MPTGCNRWFLLQILLLAQHVSGTIMPIIRSSRVLYRWLLPVVFGFQVVGMVWSWGLCVRFAGSTGFWSSSNAPKMHVVQVAAAGNTNVTAVNKRRREKSFTNARTDMWPVHVSVKHVYTSKLILACHNWNGVQNLLPSPSRYGPTINATQAVFKTTVSTKHKITENHDRAIGILSCLGGFGLKCRSGYRLTPQTLSEFRDSTSSGVWSLASSAFAVHHLALIARFDATQFKLLTAS
jgi:hypothetical protein